VVLRNDSRHRAPENFSHLHRAQARASPSTEVFVPKLSPRSTALAIGAGRVAFGVMLAAAPENGAKSFGADSATARRMAWMTRMTAVRDAAIGLGTVGAVQRGNPGPWLLAGALADLGDSLAVADGLHRGRVSGPIAWLVAAGAAPLAALGVATALGLRRGADASD
jgi:hypothetical protein